jgi:hypothetical protein
MLAPAPAGRRMEAAMDILRTALKGGCLIGGIGFLAGFLGPMLLVPDANQGPMLGIFITGPLGFLLGLFSGGLLALIRRFR